MPRPIIDDNFDSFPTRAEPIEDTFRHASSKQINYIEILRHDLGLSIPTRNAHIMTILGKSFDGDIWGLSISDASLVINKFKEWKEQRS